MSSLLELHMKCRSMTSGKCTDPLALPLYGDSPSPGVCRVCEHYRGLPRGLGDVIEAVTRWTGLKAIAGRVANRRKPVKASRQPVRAGQCGGCAARQAALNDKFPIP